jgi:sulfur-carrier protein
MIVNIITFGQLKEITGSDPIQLQNVSDTEEVIWQMEQRYPSLSKYMYIVTVNKEVITERTELTDGATIAFLPPFSGG